ncbi:hypothetical protein TWF718_005589 [Orbilia javanica]|uniref:Uncharacterized protein n=1 Tax=Orbilia javanica TaxID=47235 RepID=A0AAN8MVE5_9PEZI
MMPAIITPRSSAENYLSPSSKTLVAPMNSPACKPPSVLIFSAWFEVIRSSSSMSDRFAWSCANWPCRCVYCRVLYDDDDDDDDDGPEPPAGIPAAVEPEDIPIFINGRSSVVIVGGYGR